MKRLHDLFGGRYRIHGAVYSKAGNKLGGLWGLDETVPVLGGRYLRATGSGGFTGRPAEETVMLTSYDSDTGLYRQWRFNSLSSAPEDWTGRFENGRFAAANRDGTQTVTYVRNKDGSLSGSGVQHGPNGDFVTLRWTAVREAAGSKTSR